MRSGIDLSGWMEILGHEGFSILQVDERGWVIEVEYDTGLELTIREPRSFNEKEIWKKRIAKALEKFFDEQKNTRSSGWDFESEAV